MNTYLYRFRLHPDSGIDVEVALSAPSALVARREIERIVVHARGRRWIVDRVPASDAEVRAARADQAILPPHLPRIGEVRR